MIFFVALLMMWNIYTFESGPWFDQESVIRTVWVKVLGKTFMIAHISVPTHWIVFIIGV